MVKKKRVLVKKQMQKKRNLKTKGKWGNMMVHLDAGRNAGALFQTQYGLISGTEWLEKEAKRIGVLPGRIVEIKDNKLYVNRVAVASKI